MINLPDFNKKWDYENNFYLTCDPDRITKFIAHYELYKRVMEIPGEIIECGVFKGVSLTRFAMFQKTLSNLRSKKLIAFDSFGDFPDTTYEPDKKFRQNFITETGGGQSISVEEMKKVLEYKGCESNVELVKGNICETLPKYVDNNQQLIISLLHLDTDIYEPSLTILEHLYPRLQTGGILILDDYGTFPGETKAVQEYFSGISIKIKKFSFSVTPCYIVKE